MRKLRKGETVAVRVQRGCFRFLILRAIFSCLLQQTTPLLQSPSHGRLPFRVVDLEVVRCIRRFQRFRIVN